LNGYTNFPEMYEPSEISRLQNGDVKQFP